jgi:A/G-specific adenine glycosylase
MDYTKASFSETIILWYQQNKRNIPWRNTKDPYKVWLSEVILQQTRVAQGLPYYKKFAAAYPTVKDLAKASEEEVLMLWQGLGYYTRARNMHFTAKYIVEERSSTFPDNYKELIKLKGVGDYTASAIASFCFNEKQPVVDGNVFRILARYFEIRTPINTSGAKTKFKELAFQLIDEKQPALFNQAIMEFGSLQCRPTNPNCMTCPLNDSCIALQKNLVETLPVKNKKIKIRKRYFNYLVINTPDNQILLNKRTQNDIWKNLYDFPLIETKKPIHIQDFVKNKDFIKLVKENDYHLSLVSEMPVRKLSHQHLYIKFWSLAIDFSSDNLIPREKLLSYPFPVVISEFIINMLKI